MRMNETLVSDIWLVFKEYLDKKVVDAIATKYVDILVDNGADDDALKVALGIDEDLDAAISYYLDEEVEEDDAEYELDFED